MLRSEPCQCRQRRKQRTSPNPRNVLPEQVNCTFKYDLADTLAIHRGHVELEIGKLLGSGGFGSVFEGKCLGRRVALKKLHKNAKNPHAAVESFEAEKAVMALRHRNVVRIFAASSESPELMADKLVLMEYAGQRNLLAIINDETERINSFRRIKFATDIANALYYIHKMNIAHLDVKPANIMISAYDTCKLGDFGCCKVLSESGRISPATPTNSYLTGTLAYRSPELLKGDFPTVKADMYSYGVCLWQLLTRKRPYGSENLYVVIFGVVAYKLRPDISKNMRSAQSLYTQMIEELWTADPDARPTAQVIMHRLRTLRKRKSQQTLIRSPKIESSRRWRF